MCTLHGRVFVMYKLNAVVSLLSQQNSIGYISRAILRLEKMNDKTSEPLIVFTQYVKCDTISQQ